MYSWIVCVNISIKFHAHSINNTLFTLNLLTISKNHKSGMTKLEALY